MQVDPYIIARDAQDKAQSYAGLSRRYADGEHVWLAVHAQVAADLAAATAAAVGTDDQYWNADAAAVDIAASDLAGATARDVSFSIRSVISAHLGDAAYEQWAGAVSGLDHLEGFDAPDPDGFAESLQDRFNGAGVDEYLWVKEREATEAIMSVDPEEIVREQYDADIAAFEAWLIRHSLAIGDAYLTQYELRYSLGMAALGTLGSLPADPMQARHLVLSRMVWALGPSEGLRFVDETLAV